MENSNETIYALLPISLLGSAINWFILYSIRKLKTFNHSFGYLSANQAFADALHSTTFLLYFCPMVLLDQPVMKAYSHHCGFLLLFCYELSIFTHFVISINRFYAVWVPHKYEVSFSPSRTKWIISGIWLFVGSMGVLFYEQFCWFYYDDNIHFLTFTNTSFCGSIGWYGDFLKNAMVVMIIMIIDLLTVFRVRKATKKVSTTMSEVAHNRCSKREMRFLKQTVVQGSVFMLELLTYFFVPQYVVNQWIVFFATSFAWVAVHAADGLVVVICNPEIRKLMLCNPAKSISSTAVSASVPNV